MRNGADALSSPHVSEKMPNKTNDSINPFRDPRAPLRPLLFAGLLVALMAAVGGLYRYGVTVQSEINNLAIANSDSLQWSLAQLEVEYYHMDAALVRADPAQPDSLSAFSRSFDVFYSRVNTIVEGKGFADVISASGAGPHVVRINRFLHDTAAIVDAGPAALSAALPVLRGQTEALVDDVRSVSLEGVRTFAERAKIQREQVFSSLLRLASLTAGLLAAVSAGFVATWWLWRFGMRQTRSLSAAKARLEAVIRTSLDAVVVVDHESRVIEFNGAAEKVFGYTRQEALGHTLNDLIVPDHMKTSKESAFKRYRGGGVPRIAGHGLIGLQARRKDGSVFPAEISVTATRIDKKEIFVGYLRDISARVAAEKELIDARDAAMAGERAQAEFVAVMSHEMRTPLNGLLGTLELLGETRLDAEQRRYVFSMRKAGEVLLRHVNDTLDVERLDAGKLSLVRAPFSPLGVVEGIVQMQAGAAAMGGNTLVARAEGQLPEAVEGDAMRVGQVVLNLVGNAIKFTRNGTITIEVEYHRDQGLLEYRVIDSGIGIAPEQTERIFDDFVTLDPELSREASGTGLGLSIARRLVRAMRGQIGVESELGKGSAFWITLPVPVVMRPAQAPALSAGARPSAGLPSPVSAATGEAPLLLLRPDGLNTWAEAPGAAPRSEASATAHADPATPVAPAQGAAETLDVLVVEDNDINRVVLCEMLRRGGHRFEEARDGIEGVEVAQRGPFNAILIDLNMPRMNGVEATERIRAGNGPNKHTPIIAVTANVLPEARGRLEAAGVSRVISKPITRKMLDLVLAEALNAARHDAQPGATAMPQAVAGPAAGNTTGPSREAPVLNYETHIELTQTLGAALMAQTLAQFQAEGTAMLGRLDADAARTDPAATAALAHKFSGSAALLGAERLRRTLKAIELPLRQATPSPAGDAPPLDETVVAALEALPGVWATTQAALFPGSPPETAGPSALPQAEPTP